MGRRGSNDRAEKLKADPAAVECRKNRVRFPTAPRGEALLQKLGLLGAAVLAGCGFRAPVSSSSQANDPTTTAATAQRARPIPAPAAPTPVPAGVTPTPAVANSGSGAAATEPGAAALESVAATPNQITDEPVCVLTPQATEGPFYFDTDLVRRDIVEDRVGAPLRMAVRVVRVDRELRAPRRSCWWISGTPTPLVSIPGIPASSAGWTRPVRLFCAASRRPGPTESPGSTPFTPGWYPGRTVHIHFKVHYQGSSYVTSQFYFPDELSDRVFERSPYSDRPDRTTRNANDSVLRGDPAEGNLLATIAEESPGLFRNNHNRSGSVTRT